MKPNQRVLIVLASVFLISIALAQSLTFEAVLDIASKLGVFNSTIHPTLEREEPNEAENIKEIALAMFKEQMAAEPQSRDAHAKGHGCAVAEFKIENGIPKILQVGLFSKPGAKLPAIVRFSNGSGKTQSDAAMDAHGMAIKVIGAAPAGNLLATGTTHDFLMVNSPEFFIRSIKDYREFLVTKMRDGKPDAFILGRAVREALAEAGVPNPELIPDETIQKISASITRLPSLTALEATLKALYSDDQANQIKQALFAKLGQLSAKTAPLELKNIMKLVRGIRSNLSESYFSMSSYLLKAKSGDTAVKYTSRPVDCKTGQLISPEAPPQDLSPFFLRKDLAERLRSSTACYELSVQLLPEGVSDQDRRTLVEDSRLDYNTPEVAVARVTLKRQQIDTPAKQKYCENLSFNPWQAGASHQPLGSMNRARKIAVTFSSIRRHLFTGNERKEPQSIDEIRKLK